MKDLCQKCKVKLIFRGAYIYRLSRTGIVECLEIIDVGCNLTEFVCACAIQVLNEHGAQVDRPDFRGCSPAHLAISHGHSVTLRALVNAGAVIGALFAYMPLFSFCQWPGEFIGGGRGRCTGLDWPLCHCAVPQAHDEHRRPLAPSKFFDVCVTEKNYYR